MSEPPLVITFSIPGRPRPKQRPRFNPATGRAYTPTATQRYEREVAWYARQAMRRCGPTTFPIKHPIRLYVDLYGANPKADVDNIVKAIADGITQSRLWADDSQVITLHGDRRPADEEHKYPRRADVRLYVVGGQDFTKIPRPVGVRPTDP